MNKMILDNNKIKSIPGMVVDTIDVNNTPMIATTIPAEGFYKLVCYTKFTPIGSICLWVHKDFRKSS